MPARKPTQLLELSGAFDKNPKRRRGPEPRSSGPLGTPPDRLPEAAREYWFELVRLCPRGVLQMSDRWAVEIASRLMLKTVQDAITGTERGVLRSLMVSLGLTPVDRSRLSVSAEIPTNRFAQFVDDVQRPN